MAGRMNSRTASGLGATSFGSNKARTITVTNDEFIGAVVVANQPNFNVASYPINPGQVTTFPWLSQQARQWERYMFQKLEFYFKREVSEFALAGSSGKVIMNVDFDAADGPPTTKQQMEDSVPHIDGMPCENITLALPPRQMHPSVSLAKFVRSGGLPGSADIKTYDVGNLNVATQGIQNNVEVGELRVRYTCVFTVPVLESTASAPRNNQVAVFEEGNQPIVSGVTTTLILSVQDFNGIGAVNTAGSFILPPGNYLFDFFGTAEDDTAEQFIAVVQLSKNTVAVGTPANFAMTLATGLGAGQKIPLSGSWFESSNGTDSFTIDATLIGAAGVLDFEVSQLRIVAI